MSDGGVRLDRWLWAARFFRTRAQAKTAIEGGKVLFHQPPQPNAATLRPKVSKELCIGDYLTIRRGWTAETVRVDALSEQRGNAEAARVLYSETPESVERREAELARRRMERAGLSVPPGRPNKRERRQIRRLKEEQ